MTAFDALHLPPEPTVTAPDGSDVRVLLGLSGGGMAHFALAPGRTAKAVRHRTVEEIWFLAAVAVTMPPWPGDDEAVVVPGPWLPDVEG